MKFYFTSFIVLMFFIASTFTTTFAQTLWKKDTLNNPVMDLGKGAPGCVIFDGNTYHAWWGGKDGATYRVSYYTSADGVIWSEYLGNPVLDVGSAGNWDDEGVYRVYVRFDGELYQMWYTGLSGTRANIGYATSPDGINWTKYVGNPVLNVGSAGSWEEDVLSPCVHFDGANYHMWYEGANWPSSSIGYATSPDGLAWTKHAGNPVLIGKSGSWDYPRVEGPTVYFDGTNYHMWYSGASGSWLWQIGYATSVDGISWTKFGDNPVLDKGAPGEWDDQFAGFGTVVVDTVDHLFKMWYGGERENGSVKIGYATAPDCTVTGLFEIEKIFVPGEYVLRQNYPNPFNPTTNIEFRIPKSEFVTVTFYNILGMKVSTLVSKKLNKGNHTYTFDGKSFASGVYYYQLVAGKYRDVKKMILLR